jgi:signal transduction histidine kinase
MKRRLSLHTLRSRLLVLILMALLPAFGLAIYSAVVQFQRAEDEAYEMVGRAVRLSVRSNARAIAEARVLLGAVAGRKDATEMCDLLRSLPLDDAPFSRGDTGVADASARTLCRSEAATANGYLGEAGRRAIARAAASGRFAAGGHEINRATGNSALIVAHPVPGPQVPGELFVYATLPLDWFEILARDLRLLPDSALTIVDSRATVLARYPNAEDWVGTKVAEGPLFRMIAGPALEGTGETTGLDGVRRLYAFARLEDSELDPSYIAVGIPSAHAFSAPRQALIQNLAVLIALAIATLAGTQITAERSVLRQARALTAAARQLAGGDLTARVEHSAHKDDELTRLGAAFNEMAASMQRAQALEHQRYEELAERDHALRAAVEMVKLQRERLDLLSRELLRAQEAERQHIARELHDEIGQTMTALKINLQIERSTAADSTRLDDSIQIVNRMLTGVRELALRLRPPLLHEAGLARALSYLLESEGRRSGLRLDSRIDTGDARFDPETELVIYRIVQESLTNAVRHAQAQCVEVRLAARGGMLELSVKDDGVGFDLAQTAAPGRGFGLLSMQERAVLAGGDLRIDSTSGAGTTVHARIPARPAADGA